MPKVILRTLDNLENQPTALAVLNQNFAALQTVVDSLLSRDGSVPNQMVAVLDMNNRKIINLPVPTTPTEPARHGDIQQYVDQAHAYADAAHISDVNAEASEAQTLVYLKDFLSRYVGTYAEEPSVDSFDRELLEGSLYFNSTFDLLSAYTVKEVLLGTDEVLVGTEQVVVSTWVAIPINKIASMSDIDISMFTNNQFMQWNASLQAWMPFTLNADTVSFDDGLLTSGTVQDAIDEIVSRVVLGAYDIQFYIAGLMADGESLYKYIALRAFGIPSNTTGFVATAGVAATDNTVVVLKKNGTQFGTITWAAAGTVGTWSIPGDTTFAVGDVLTLAGPAVPDTTLRDVIIGMIASR